MAFQADITIRGEASGAMEVHWRDAESKKKTALQLLESTSYWACHEAWCAVPVDCRQKQSLSIKGDIVTVTFFSTMKEKA